MSIPVVLMGQQSGPIRILTPIDSSHYALYGVGSLNSESLNNQVNGSGKLAGYANLYKHQDLSSYSISLAVNRNASNNDSTLATTLLFPEVGKASFIGTFHALWSIDRKSTRHTQFFGPFVQSSIKSIKGERTVEHSNHDTTTNFNVLDWQFGVQYIKDLGSRTSNPAFFSASLFFNLYDIPDEDNEDYRFIFNQKTMPSSFKALGIKLSLEIKSIQLFGDFRHVFGNAEKVPSRDLRGFNMNVGVIFNAGFVEVN
jgi:hypothetical protein